MSPEGQSHAYFEPVARCGAKTRAGPPCRNPAMPNGRCRMHGGTAGAPFGNRNAWKHGLYSREAIALRKEMTAFLRGCRETILEVERAIDIDADSSGVSSL